MTLASWLATATTSADLRDLILALADGARELAAHLQQGPVAEGAIGRNLAGDSQKPLDLVANAILMDALRRASVRAVVSEEEGDAIILDKEGRFDVVIDPLDGSGNIGLNMPIGTIFGVYPVGPNETHNKRSGHEQVAAGFVVYGIQTELIVSLGDPPVMFALAGATFVPSTTQFAKLSERATTLAANTSNLSRWDPRLASYVEARFRGGTNMRWVGSLVAETRRILTEGGVLLYPGDNRPGYTRGRLRLVYEAHPIAWLIVRAGGRATNGMSDVLACVPGDIHERSPLVFGCSADIADIAEALSPIKEKHP